MPQLFLTLIPCLVYVALLGTVGLIHSVSGVGYALQSLGIKLPKIPSSIRKALVWLAPVAMISTGLALAGIYGPFNFTAEQLALARQEHADKPFILEAINAKFGK